MEFIPIILQLIAGAAGGLVAGRLWVKADEGRWANLVIGVLGGFLFAQLLGWIVVGLIPSTGTPPLPYVISSLLGGAFGGAALLYLVGSVGRQPVGRA